MKPMQLLLNVVVVVVVTVLLAPFIVYWKLTKQEG